MSFFRRSPETLNEHLLKAAKDSNLDDVQDAVEAGADVNATDAKGYTALYYAIKREREKTALYLLENGADPNRQIDGSATLLTMSFTTWREISTHMLAHGADPKLTARDGSTALVAAYSYNRTLTAKKLIDMGVDVNAAEPDGRRALHAAAQLPSIEAMKLLLEKGADINAQDAQGRTALHIAAKNNAANVVIFLLEQGAGREIFDKEGKTPAAYAEKHSAGLAALLRGGQPDALRQSQRDGWKLLADDEVAHVTPKDLIGYRVTEIFNFSARTYTQVMRNLDTGQESQSIKMFSAMAEGGLIAEAHEALQRLGGRANDGSVKKRLSAPGGANP